MAATAATDMLDGPAHSHDPVRQLGLVVSLTAGVLLPAVCECLRLFPCAAATRRAVECVVWLRNVQHTACWVVQWLLLLLLQAALVDVRGREQGEEQQGAAGATRRAVAGHGQGAPGEAGPGVAVAWRRQLLDTLYVVGTLCGVVRLLAAFPRVCLGTGPGEEQQLLRALLPPGALAACLDAAAVVFPQEVHVAFCSQAPAAGQGQGQGQGGQGRGGGNGQALATKLFVRLLLHEGGPLELDGGA